MKTNTNTDTVTLTINMQLLNNAKSENGRLRTKVGMSLNGRRLTHSVPSKGVLTEEQKASLQLEAALEVVMKAARRGWVDFLTIESTTKLAIESVKQTAESTKPAKKSRKVQTAAEIAAQLEQVIA